MSAELWAVVGVVVGSILGGGAQVIADVLRGRRERKRWIDDHRRTAYLTFLEAVEDLTSAMQSDSAKGLGQDSQMPETGKVHGAFFQALHTLNFYGSTSIRNLAEDVEDALMVDAFASLQTDAFPAFVTTLRDIRPKIGDLSDAMRRELGVRS